MSGGSTPIFAGHAEGIAVELLRIVDVDRLRDAGRWPNHLFQCFREVHRFPTHAMIKT